LVSNLIYLESKNMNKCLLFLLLLSSKFTEQFSSNFLESKQCQTKSNGTTKNLEQIFLGRCYYFLNIQQISNCDINPTKYDCAKIFNSFRTALVGKTPCSVNVTDFSEFLSLVDHPIAANTSVFWSGTYTPTHDCM